MDVGRSHLRSPFFSRSSFTALLRLFIFSSFLPYFSFSETVAAKLNARLATKLVPVQQMCQTALAAAREGTDK